MAEPEKQNQDESQSYLRSVPGGSNTVPGRANLKLIDDQESNPEQPNSNAEDLKTSEESPWTNKYTGQRKELEESKKRTLSEAKGFFKLAKGKGPITSIISLLIAGTLGIGGLLSPSLLLVNIKELLVEKFNVQLTSMEVRTNKILVKKVTGGACGAFKISCKYSSLSEKQLTKFAKAGITVKSTKVSTLGKVIPDEFEFEGRAIKAADFSDTMNKSPSFRTAIKKAYNSKFAGFADTIFSKLIAKWRISTSAAKITGDNDAEKMKSIQDQTRTGDLSASPKASDVDIDETTPKVDEDGKPIIDPETNKPITYSAEEVASKKALVSTVNKIGDEAADIARTGVKVGGAALDAASSIVKISGVADNACTVYGMVQALGYGAKTVRAVQLARYAMIFLNVADQIKAGVAKPEDVAYLGGILTMEMVSLKTSMKMRSATDSFGYKYIAYGEKGKMTNLASQFLAGGGLVGDLIYVTSSINGILGGSPQKTCGFLKNPFVGFGSAIIGIASMATPIGWGKVAVQAGISLAMSAATVIIPQMLKDIVAGVLVDDTTVGEASMEAITSGSSGMMGLTANRGGNAPLTVEQKLAYDNLSKEIIAQYEEEDRLAYSPFDTSNKNTFLGKFVASLTPYVSKMSSLSGILSSVASLSTSSLSRLTSQYTYAAELEDYSSCQDYDYRSLNLATDPYCNVAYGIPVEYLDIDPIVVSDKLANDGHINPDTGEIVSKKYLDFVDNCINRETPLGYTGDTFDSELTGETCLVNESNPNNKYFYLYFIDQRVEKGMDGEDPVLEANSILPNYGEISFFSYINNYDDLAENSAVDNNEYSNIQILPEESQTTTAYPIKTNTWSNKLTSLFGLSNFTYVDTNRYRL